MEKIWFVDNNSPGVVFHAGRSVKNFLDYEQGCDCVVINEARAQVLLNMNKWRLETMDWLSEG
jgi:hypothetical protein